jgi:hypothetical protein
VTAQPIAPVIPTARSARHRQGGLRAAAPLPLASPPDRPDVVYGFGRIDASGRVADRAIISALGWRGGDRLTLTVGAGVMVARRDPGGMVTMPARPYIVIPAAVRHRCGLRACGLVPTGRPQRRPRVGHSADASPGMQHGSGRGVRRIGIPAEEPAEVLDQGRRAYRACQQMHRGVAVAEIQRIGAPLHRGSRKSRASNG